jgi:hypothetical protein
MFYIKVNDKYLVFDSEATLSLNIAGQMFDTEFIPAQYSYPFESPICPKNNLIFEFGNDVRRRNKKRIFDCEYGYKGKSLGNAKLFLERTNTNYVGNLQLIQFAVDISEVYLKDLDFGEGDHGWTSWDTVLDEIKEINNDTVDVPFRFPTIYNPDFFEDNPDYIKFINLYDAVNGIFRRNPINSDTYTTEETPNNPKYRYPICPQFQLMFIIEEIALYFGYEAIGNLFDVPYFEKIFVYSNLALEEKDYYKNARIVQLDNTSAIPNPNGIHLEWFFMPDLTATLDSEGTINPSTHKFESRTSGVYTIQLQLTFGGTINPGDFSSFHVEVVVGSSVVASSNIYTIDDTNTVFTISVDAQVNNGDIMAFTLIQDSGSNGVLWIDTLIISTASISIFLKDPYYTPFSDVTATNHMPNMTVADFFNSLRKYFNLKINFDTQNRTIQLDVLSIFVDNANRVDITPITALVPELEFADKQEFEFKFSYNEDDFANSSNLPDYITGKNAVTVNPNLSPLTDARLDAHPEEFGLLNALTYKILCPSIKALGRSTFNSSQDNRQDLHLFFWHGMTHTTKTLPSSADYLYYPLGSSNKLSPEGVDLGGWNLGWMWGENTFTKFWETWFNKITDYETVKIAVKLDTQWIDKLNEDAVVVYKDTEFIIVNFEYNLSKNGITGGMLEMRKLT